MRQLSRIFNSRPIRRSQAIVPFGVGSLVDFPGESLMAAGLDVWSMRPEDELRDDRFAQRLRVEYFRQPPRAPERANDGGALLPFVRFPLWHFCPRCRVLVQLAWNTTIVPRCESEDPWRQAQACAKLSQHRRPKLVPVRFVVACEDGHIEDFPWMEWAHHEGDGLARGRSCTESRLRLETRPVAGLGGLVVHCLACDKKRTLLGASQAGALDGIDCRGHRPWLGPRGEDMGNCARRLRLVQRGGSNVYFPEVRSSILIPQYSRPCREVIDANWDELVDVSIDERAGMLRVYAKQRNIPLEELQSAFKLKLEGKDAHEVQTEEEYRYVEYEALLKPPRGEPHREDLVTRQLPILEYEPWLRDLVDNIVLVERLTETRALTGFTRVKPGSGQGRPDPWLSVQRLPWLPAVRVFGEGIFVTLAPKEVKRFERKFDQRFIKLTNRMPPGRNPAGQSLRPALILVHTLAHLLIRRLAFECGYGAASLRERLYCSPPEWEDRWMCGLLIYTAAGDAEGTMGGLVQQGLPGRLERVVHRALEDARWCASDPLCQESQGQGAESLNLAACHACVLLPETCCEMGNRLLDRVAVVGRNDQPELGFAPRIGPK